MDETDTTTMDFGRLSFGERKNKKKYVYINCKTCPGIYVKRHVSNKSKFYRRPSDLKLFEHIATIEGKEFYKKKNCTKQHKTKFGCGSPGGGCHSGFGAGPSISQFSSNRFGRLPPLGAINAPYSKGKFGIPLTPFVILQVISHQQLVHLNQNSEGHVSYVRTVNVSVNLTDQYGGNNSTVSVRLFAIN